MSAETTGIPLVVRYNNQGQPDGLKEQLDIVVNSISAVEFIGGGLTVTKLDSLTSIDDVTLTSLNNGDVLTWTGGGWVNQQPTGGPGGSTYFTQLLDVPNSYTDPLPPDPKSILRLDPTAFQGGPGLVFSNYGEDDLDDFNNLYTGLTALPANTIVIKDSDGDFTTIGLDRGNPVTQAGDAVVVFNPGGTGLTYSNVTKDELEDFNSRIISVNAKIDNKGITELSDTTGLPAGSNIGDNYLLAYDTSIGKWKPVAPTAGVVGTFTGLSDTPDGYTGSDDKILAVDFINGVPKIIFSQRTVQDITTLQTDLSNLGTAITNLKLEDLYNVISTTAGDGQILVYSTTANQWIYEDNCFTKLCEVNPTSITVADANKLLSVDSTGGGIEFSTYTTTNLGQFSAKITEFDGYFTSLPLGSVITKGTVAGIEKIINVGFTLANLTDTDIPDPNNIPEEDFLVWSSANSNWRNSSFRGIKRETNPGGYAELYLEPSGLKATSGSGFNNGDLLSVNPSGEVVSTSVSSLLLSAITQPLADQEGKLRIIDANSVYETNSSALTWDYPSETLNIAGDVSAENFYGSFAGASGVITNLSGVSSIQFAIDMPAEYTAVEGEVYYDTDAHTLSIQTGANTTLQVGQEQVIRVRNETGAQITDGTVVYVSGTQGTGVAKLLIGKADASVSEEDQDIIGIVTETINDNSDGFITTFGLVRNVNTSGFAAGTLLYLGETPGTFTDTAPNSGFHTIRLGVVLREHQTDGVIFTKIDPGYDLENLHDVNISGIQSGDILRWNGTELTPSAFDHGQMAGLSDDDHSQYVFKSPTGSGRNTIQPGADVPALTLQEGLTQTQPLLIIKDALTTTTLTVDGEGNIDTTGRLTAESKSFLIDHPTKEGMKLQYTCLEGPENGVYCRGRVKTNVILLPEYWVGLVDEDTITVNLTAAGKRQPNLFVEDIRDNKIFLSSSESIDCFYTVFGERKDIDRLIVEF